MRVAVYTLPGLLNPHEQRWEPVTHESCVFYNEGGESLRKVFLSTAADTLLAEPDSRVYFFPAPEVSPDDALLRSLSTVNRFHMVRCADGHKILQQLVKDAADIRPHIYIFIEDVERCVPRDAWPLLQRMMDVHHQKIHVFLSTRTHFPHPSHIWSKHLHKEMVTTALGTGPGLLIPSSHLPGKVQKLLQDKPAPRKPRKNTPPTLAQIILAVTAALLAFIASQLGG